jgi:hypothetical protein
VLKIVITQNSFRREEVVSRGQYELEIELPAPAEAPSDLQYLMAEEISDSGKHEHWKILITGQDREVADPYQAVNIAADMPYAEFFTTTGYLIRADFSS